MRRPRTLTVRGHIWKGDLHGAGNACDRGAGCGPAASLE